MFQNRHPAQFLTHYLNTSVFSSPSQTQIFALFEQSILNLQANASSPVLSTTGSDSIAQKLIDDKLTTEEGGTIKLN